MKPYQILASRGEEKFQAIVREIRGEERRILFSKYHVHKAGKRLLDMEKRRMAQIKALWAVMNEQKSDELAEDLLRAWLRDCRSSLLATFLDALGVENEGGITDEKDWKEKIKKGDVDGGIRKLKESFDPEDTWIYLNYLDLEEVERSPEMAALLAAK